jgi:hypothetical protein
MLSQDGEVAKRFFIAVGQMPYPERNSCLQENHNA